MQRIAVSSLRPIAAAILIAAMGAALIAPTAEAAEIRVERREVPYGDLDLTRADGVRSLKSRVNSAMRALCKVGHRWSLEEAVQQRTCLAQARASVGPQFDRAVATALARQADRVMAAAGAE